MNWMHVGDAEELSITAARMLLSALATKPALVLGLPTGRTPEGMYRRVIGECSRQYYCFAEATTFNLDEYVGIPSSHPGSYCSYMKRNLFSHVDIDPDRIHIPNGMPPALTMRPPDISAVVALERECARYEEDLQGAGSLDLTFLGLGTNGHIGFNEPGTDFASRTRIVRLTEATRRANAEHFPGEEVPGHAITMGIATILESRSIVLMASGSKKASVIRRLATESTSDSLPASALHAHKSVLVIVDSAASALL